MFTSPNLKHRTPVTTALLAFAALLLSLVIGPAPTASADFSGVIGNPGQYEVVKDSAGRQAMIRGIWDTYVDSRGEIAGRRTFWTNGVTTQRSTASTHAQTVNATYKLQRWSTTDFTWVTLQEVTKQKTLPAFEEGVTTSANMGGHWFDNPPATASDTAFRVMYVVVWVDNDTGAQLGYHDVYPQLQNNFCTPATGAPECSVWNENIRW